MSLFTPPLAVGTPAPDFSVPNQDGSRVTLSAYRGKNVILVFYPADNTSVCTKQLCEFRDRWAEVLAKNAVVFGVNHIRFQPKAAFHKKYQFPFPLLCDREMTVAKLYQAAGWFAPKRTVYLIGPDGNIRYARRGKPSPQEVLAAAS
jgi:peroxiredoxin Q/BCP